MIQVGDTIPDAKLATIDESSRVTTHSAHDLFQLGRYVLVGIPGAFTPVCTHQHLPEVIKNAPVIRDQDVSDIYCISDDNPWALLAWREQLPGHEAITFLSDGNREFLNAAGLHNHTEDMFVSGCYARFFAIIDNLVLKSLNVEDDVRDVTCSTGQAPEAYCV